MSLSGDLREGWRFVRRRSWLWATFGSAAIAYLLFMGPVEVLLPLLVKHELHGTATELGLVFAAGGLGSVACAVALGRRGLPRRDITFMYVVWTLATLAVAGYGLSRVDLAADARLHGLQRVRDGRHDRLGDGEAAPRAGRHARTRLEPRLAHLDRAAAALVRAHRARSAARSGSVRR